MLGDGDDHVLGDADLDAGPDLARGLGAARSSAATRRSPCVTAAEGNGASTIRSWSLPSGETSSPGCRALSSASRSCAPQLVERRALLARRRARRRPRSSSDTNSGLARSLARRMRAASASRAASRSAERREQEAVVPGEAPPAPSSLTTSATSAGSSARMRAASARARRARGARVVGWRPRPAPGPAPACGARCAPGRAPSAPAAATGSKDRRATAGCSASAAPRAASRAPHRQDRAPPAIDPARRIDPTTWSWRRRGLARHTDTTKAPRVARTGATCVSLLPPWLTWPCSTWHRCCVKHAHGARRESAAVGRQPAPGAGDLPRTAGAGAAGDRADLDRPARDGRRARRRRPRAAARAAARPRVLFIGGTINHTTQVQQIAAELPECDRRLHLVLLRRPARAVAPARLPRIDRARQQAARPLPRLSGGAAAAAGPRRRARRLRPGRHLLGPGDARATCAAARVVLVQEGMTDPEDLIFRIIKALRLPPWLAATSSATGLSHAYDRFCVASDGYRAPVHAQGRARATRSSSPASPTSTTASASCDNDFPHRGYVLVCSSDIRETARWEDRPRFIREVVAHRRRPADHLEAAPQRERRPARAPSSAPRARRAGASTAATPRR